MAPFTTDNSGRLEYIDIAKGLGILFVLIGHSCLPSAWLIQFIYSFHMPLFFLISGMLYRPERHTEWRKFTRRRTQQLLVPLLLYNILLFAVRALLYGISRPWETLSIGHHFQGGAQWFIFALYVAEIAFWGICAWANDKKARIIAVLTFFYLLMDYVDYRGWDLPFQVSSIPAATFYYAVGFWGKTIVRRILEASGPYVGWLLILLTAVNAIFVGTGIELYHARVGTPSVYYVAISIAASLGWFIVSMSIPSPVIREAMKYIGANSLVIVCVHQAWMELSREFFQRHIEGWAYGWVELIFACFCSVACIEVFKRYLPVLTGRNT